MTVKTLNRSNQTTMADRWLAALCESRDDLLETLQPVTHELLHWHPFPEAHSIANYLWHVANVQLWWVQSVLLGRTLLDTEKARFGLTTPGDIQMAPASMTIDVFKDLLSESLSETIRAYQHMRDETFTAPSRPLGAAGSQVSPEWILYNLLDHEANHRGQIAMMVRWGTHPTNGN